MTPRPLDSATPDQPAPDTPETSPDLGLDPPGTGDEPGGPSPDLDDGQHATDADRAPDEPGGNGGTAGTAATAATGATGAIGESGEAPAALLLDTPGGTGGTPGSVRPAAAGGAGGAGPGGLLLDRPGAGGGPAVSPHPEVARPQRAAAGATHGSGGPGPVSGWGYCSWGHQARSRRDRVAEGGVPYRARIEGLLLGLAAGDAAGWPAARHRAARMPEWTRRLTRELDTFAEQNATTTLPVPIALNQPPEPLRLGPSDDAEWAAFAAETVLTAAGEHFDGLDLGRRMRAAVDLAWNVLAGKIAAAAARAPEVESAVLPLRARISVRAGLGNLATGLRPPATGHDNPHYFDDAACIRASVLAVIHPGNPQAAADLAEFDARYTQDGDGVHGARAMAAAVASALGGADVDTAVDAALAQLPEATEIGRNARYALKLARDADDAFSLVPLLEHQIVDHVYSYGIAAAETVPVALALAAAARGEVAGAIPAAVCLSRVADSAPALAGALTGALGGGSAVPAAWRDACRTLAGCTLPRLAGTDLVELAGLLAHTIRPSHAPSDEQPHEPAYDPEHEPSPDPSHSPSVTQGAGPAPRP